MIIKRKKSAHYALRTVQIVNLWHLSFPVLIKKWENRKWKHIYEISMELKIENCNYLNFKRNFSHSLNSLSLDQQLTCFIHWSNMNGNCLGNGNYFFFRYRIFCECNLWKKKKKNYSGNEKTKQNKTKLFLEVKFYIKININNYLKHFKRGDLIEPIFAYFLKILYNSNCQVESDEFKNSFILECKGFLV